MTLDQTVDLLTVAAVFDGRHLGEADAVAWHAAIGDVGFADARRAVIAHYQESRERIMPADVRRRVKAVRRERLDRHPVPAPPAETAADPHRFLAALRAGIRAVAEGLDIRRAVSPPAPRTELAAGFRQARAALPPRRAAKREHPDPREIAKCQVAESRAARAAAAQEPPEES